MQSERHVNSLKSSLDEREKELNTAAQKLQEALSASAASEITIKQLEQAMQTYVETYFSHSKTCISKSDQIILYDL